MESDDEQIIRLITDSTNRAILTTLSGASHKLEVTEIAEQLVSQDAIALRPSDYENKLEQTVISLHHKHLPQLDEAGLITYDRNTNIATISGDMANDVEWGEIEVIDELLSQSRTGRRTSESAIGVLEGKEKAYEYGRKLADKAENELFLIYTSVDLLDEECLPNAKNAIERGVEFYAGAKSQDTRQFFQEYLPEATVWEPQLDWLNKQSSYPTISRLIFADREKVIVGLWIESHADGTQTEIAMIGEGSDNPLVVLVRELLGSRLDHLDYQSEDFLEGLPFET
ncbi:DUF7344 domain-containing protein [Haladaptatus halobius]|uniref:DUF7344 domain-containing protein n=1 Tax=Haladaptatus halobius TaxID=2884875 RepID=UPI001D0ACDC0|nr:hypothetical protein [Haladaptatus halobius]